MAYKFNDRNYIRRAYINLKKKNTDEINWNKCMYNTCRIIENGNALRVYLYLCECYNIIDNKNYAFPTIDTIAKELNMNNKTVFNAIVYLEKINIIEKFKYKSNTNNNNCYRVYYFVELNEETEKELTKELLLSELENKANELFSEYNYKGKIEDLNIEFKLTGLLTDEEHEDE